MAQSSTPVSSTADDSDTARTATMTPAELRAHKALQRIDRMNAEQTATRAQALGARVLAVGKSLADGAGAFHVTDDDTKQDLSAARWRGQLQFSLDLALVLETALVCRQNELSAADWDFLLCTALA